MNDSNSYSDKLRDPRWQRKRLSIFDRDGFRCQDCGRADREIHCHHRYYVNGRNPWDYPDGALQTLCVDCHKKFSDRMDVGSLLHDGFSHWELAVCGLTEMLGDRVLWDLCAALHNNAKNSDPKDVIASVIQENFRRNNFIGHGDVYDASAKIAPTDITEALK